MSKHHSFGDIDASEKINIEVCREVCIEACREGSGTGSGEDGMGCSHKTKLHMTKNPKGFRIKSVLCLIRNLLIISCHDRAHILLQTDLLQ